MTQATSGKMFPSDVSATGSATAKEIQAAIETGLYANSEHDACGVGFVAHIKGHKAHSIVAQGLKILENIDHRGAVGADPLMVDLIRRHQDKLTGEPQTEADRLLRDLQAADDAN